MNKNISVLLVASAMITMMGAGCSLISDVVNPDTNNVGESLTEYFNTREQFRNNEMQKNTYGMNKNKNPDELGFIELASTVVTCPDSAGTPCSGEVLILSKDALHSGDQEFYLAQTAGFGHIYYGPFTDNLQRIVDESKSATLVAGPIGTTSKTFQSKQDQFSYTLHWSPSLNTLSDTARPETSEGAPSFEIVGGGTITIATGWIDSPGYTMADFINDTYYNGDNVWPTVEPTPSSTGTTYPVYYFSRTPAENNSACFVQYAVVKDLNEALAVRMEDCDSNDMKAGQAFGDIYNDLEIVRK